jgi:cytochrome c
MSNKILWLSCFVASSLCQQVWAISTDTAAAEISAASAVPIATTAVQAPVKVTADPEASGSAVVVEQPSQVNGVGASAPPIEIKVQPEQAITIPPVRAARVADTPVKIPAKSQAVISESYFMNLAKKRGCFECHELGKKTVGPAWKDIATKYRGDAGAQAKLVTKIAEGGGGVWGKKSMTAQTHTSKAERTLMVKFILNLK